MKGGVAPTVTNAAVRRAWVSIPLYSARLPRSTSMAPESIAVTADFAASCSPFCLPPKKPKKPPPCFFFSSCLSCALVLRFSFLRLMTVPTLSSEVTAGLGLTGSGAVMKGPLAPTAAKEAVRRARPTIALASGSNITGSGTKTGSAAAATAGSGCMSMSAAASSSSSTLATSGMSSSSGSGSFMSVTMSSTCCAAAAAGRVTSSSSKAGDGLDPPTTPAPMISTVTLLAQSSDAASRGRTASLATVPISATTLRPLTHRRM
mmetsp:Transcript_2878/g.12340  ORF Transcript_2878/g.12340 Transcript_2878/m.12340 type:complete len:262 (+) Transcript_2878:2218-3003(+)